MKNQKIKNQGSKPRKRIIFLVGPTAIGKSEVAVHLAKKINAEVVSCDSMQIYKKMDIITSKPSRALRRKARHHLIDMFAPTREYNVSRYRKDALKKIREVMNRGRFPLFAGGTGLYMSVLIDGIFEMKAQDRAVREKFYKKAVSKGSIFLHNKLKEADPEAAEKIHPNDLKRIIRALEVFEITGKPISELQKQRKGLSGEFECFVFGINMDRKSLYKRIDGRVEKMFKRGLIPEVKKLLKLKLSKTASCAIGINELKGYLGGLYGLEEAKRLMKRNTRRYAKRQLTWFRKDKRIKWIDITQAQGPKEVANNLWKKLS